MIVQHFLKWVESARVVERAAAANALARAYVVSEMSFEDRCAAEAALTLLLDDPSPKVRMSMAEALSMSRHAPVQVIATLASDQDDIASLVLARSPLLQDNDLIDRVAVATAPVQVIIARRSVVSMSLAAAIAEVGEPQACIALLQNDGAEIAAISLRRMAERLGSDGKVRSALLDDARLPAETRHQLLVRLGEALRESGLVKALMGKARAERVTREACVRACLTLTEQIKPREFPALVEHLRVRGDLTTAFVVRTLAAGKVDFFGAMLVSLTDQNNERVQAILSEGRDAAVLALFRKASLPVSTHAPLVTGLKIWRDVAGGKRVSGMQEVLWAMMATGTKSAEQAGRSAGNDDLVGLLKKLYVEIIRDNARNHALAIAAA